MSSKARSLLPKPPFSKKNKKLLDSVLSILIGHMKEQIEQGRPGPSILDFDAICENLRTGRMQIRMIEGNPPYPELVFIP